MKESIDYSFSVTILPDITLIWMKPPVAGDVLLLVYWIKRLLAYALVLPKPSA